MRRRTIGTSDDGPGQPGTGGPLRPPVLADGPLSVRWLVAATLAFLALPVAIFLLGWLRWPWAAVGTAALLWSVWAAWARLAGPGPGGDGAAATMPRQRPVAGPLAFVAGCLVLALVASLNGAGGVGIQVWDWEKHQAILADLVTQDWPVVYGLGGEAGDVGLVYYLAFYLPAALAGGSAGWATANVVLFAWTVIGVILAWQWVARLGGGSSWVALAVVVLFSGFDLLGALIFSQRFSEAGLPWWQDFDLEWWHGRFVYPGNVTLIAYAPHQALGGWLASALSLEALRRGVGRFPHGVALTLCLLWSPFAALGLALLIVVFVAVGPWRGLERRLGCSVRGQLSLASLAILVGVALPLLVYFAARLPPPDLPADLSPPQWARDVAAPAILPARLGVPAFVGEWGRFLAVEWLPLFAGLFAVLWTARRRHPGAGRFTARSLLAAVVVLAALPIVSYGFYDDWVMRVSIPSLFALQVLVARALQRSTVPPSARSVFVVVLAVAALFPLAQLRLHAVKLVARGAWVERPALTAVDDLFAQQRGKNRHFGFVEQYVASTERPFFTWLARRPLAPRPVAVQRQEPSAGTTRNN